MSETVFHKIINRELPANILFEDEHCIVISDLHPVAETHLLIIPKKTISKISEATQDDASLLGHLLLVAAKIAEENGVAEDGYRLVINNGENAGQTVFQLHLHLLAGRKFKWPPG